jgi:acyl-CoA synthetase (AMP-forming)/AMP-acid ligase II
MSSPNLITPPVGQEPADFWEVLAATEAFGDRPAVILGDRVVTYPVLRDRALRLAGALAGLGLKPGDAVATLAGNGIEMPEQIIGLAVGGFVRVGLYTHQSVDTNAYLASMVGVRALIVHADYAGDVARFRAECPGLERVVVWGGPHDAGGDMLDYEALVQAAQPLAARPEIGQDHLHVVRFSGGTTGRPKGIFHSVGRWLRGSLEFERAFPVLGPADTYLVVGQLTHASIIPFWSMIRAGARIVLTGSFDAGETLRLIERHRATFTVMVPTMIADMVKDGSVATRDLSSLRAIHYGAAPISEATLAAAMPYFGHALFQAYGQSEAWPVSVLTPQDHKEGGKLLRSVGRATPNSVVVAVDEEGRPRPEGEIGELAIRAEGLMDGLWGDPRGLVDKLTPDGMLLSGDVGYVDEDGYIYLVNRKNDLIISGGYNIWPAELELVLENHPAVREVCVFGVPHPRWGETPLAAVALADGAEVAADELIELTRKSLGPVKKITSVVFLDALPRTALGKVSRQDLREPYWASVEGDIAGS